MDSPRSKLPLATTDPAAAAEPSRGVADQVLAGKYRLVREIGRGGMGCVWQAEQLAWGGAPVAVKLMTLPDTPLARARFRREVCVAAALRGQHVVHVIEDGIDDATGVAFIAMELLEGESLGGRLRRLKVLSPGEVMLVVSHVGRALSRAHAAGVVHRDLKPDNIFIVDNGDDPEVKVLDFGLAKAFDVMMPDNRVMTVPGNAVGTPRYMSPEQLRPFAGVVRAEPFYGDLWSLAVIVFECLVGRPPFIANDLPELTLLLWSEKRPVPSERAVVPSGFDEWFAKATHRDIEHRFQRVEELVDALGDVCKSSRMDMPPLDYERLSHPRTSSLAPVTRPPEARSFWSRRAALGLSLIGGLLLGSVPAYFFLAGSASLAPPPSAQASLPLTPQAATAPPAAALQGQLATTVHEPAPASPTAGHGRTAPDLAGAPAAPSQGSLEAASPDATRVPPARVARTASRARSADAQIKPRKPTKERPQLTRPRSVEPSHPSIVREF